MVALWLLCAVGSIICGRTDATSVSSSHNDSSSSSAPYTNSTTTLSTTPTTTSYPSLTSSLSQNQTANNSTSSSIWSLWTTAHYPADCDAYYSTVSAIPASSTAWNATQNTFFSSAYDCLTSLLSYSSASESFENSHQWIWWSTIVTVQTPDYGHETYTSTEYKLTTLCDGYPRAITGPDAWSTVQTTTATYTVISALTTETYNTTYSTSTAPYTLPPPACSLNCEACSMLYAAADYSVSALDAKSQYSAAYDIAWPWDCPFAPDPDDTNKDGEPDCVVQVWSAQLFYWPVTVTGGDLCNKTGTTVTAAPTGNGPNTFHLNGTILTSPTVYVSFYNLSYESVYYNNTYSYVGNTLMSFNATDIQSQRGYHGSGGNFSFNYADLPPNSVPAAPWFGQAACFPDTSECLPIGGTSYQPGLVFPSVFYTMSDLNPKWTAKQCQLGVENDGIWDPPVACQPVSTEAGPSVPAQAPGSTTTSSTPETTQAQPSSTPTHPATETATPSTGHAPSSTETQGAGGTQPTSPSSTPQGVAPATHSESTQDQGNPTSEQGVPDSVPAESDTDPISTADASGSIPSTSPAAGSADPSQADPDDTGSSFQSHGSGNDPSTDDSSPIAQTPSTTEANIGGIIASAIGITKSSSDDTAAENAASVFASALGQSSQGSPATASAGFEAHSSDLADPVTAATGSAAIPSNRQGTSNGATAGAQIITVGQSTVTASADPNGRVAVDGKTYDPGQSITIGSQVVNVDSAGNVVDGTSTLMLAADSLASANEGTFTGAAGQNIRVSQQGSSLEIADESSTVLLSAGQLATFDGKTISTAQSGTALEASELATSTQAAITGVEGQYIAVQQDGSSLELADAASTVMLSAGQVVTFDGKTVSAGPGGSEAVIDGTATVTAIAAASSLSTAGLVAVLTAGSSTYTATEEGSGTAVIGGTTLSVGGQPVTIADETISAASSGLVVDGTSTIMFSSNAAAAQPSGGNYGNSGGQVSPTTTASPSLSAASAATSTTSPGQGPTTSAAASPPNGVPWMGLGGLLVLALQY